METEIQLNNVIHAPGMQSNLFSLGTVYDLGYETRITPGKGLRVFHDDTAIIQTNREESGLFRIIMAQQATAHAKAAQVDKARIGTAQTGPAQIDGIPELDIEIWHRRMVHLNEDYIRKLSTMADGMNIKARTTVGDCDACMEGKQHRQPSHKPATTATGPLELIHSDLCGQISPMTYGGTKYFLLFIDDWARYTHVYPLKRKTSKSVLEKFQEYKAEVEKQLGRSSKRLRTDGGGEDEKWMGSYLKKEGIVHETTAPYSTEQNGVAERANRTIIERVKAIISEGKLDKRLWMELTQSVVYLKNRSQTKAVETTPYEMWYGVKPSLSHIRILGSAAHILVPSEKRTKLDMNSHKGILVGYGGKNQYRVWDFERNDVVVSRDVKVNEGAPTMQTGIQEEPKITVQKELKVTAQGEPNTTAQGEPDTSAQGEPRIIYDHITLQPEPEPEHATSDEPEQADPRVLLQNTGPEQRASGRPGKGTFKTKRYADIDWSQNQATANIVHTLNPDGEAEPATMREALNHPTRGKQWEQAFWEEYNSLIKNGT